MAKLDTSNKLDTENRLKVTNNLETEAPLKVTNALEEQSTVQAPIVSDPLSPARTGLPVIVKDLNGNRIGNVWSPNQKGLKEAIASVANGDSGKIYLDTKTQTFTNAPISTMTYKDGKINLNVADDVANSSWYKNIFGSQMFKDLATAYAYDPSGETELEIEKDGKTEKHTINDLLEGFAKDLRENSEKYKGYIDLREYTRNATGGAMILTDDDINILQNWQTFSKESFSDADAIPLPEWARDYFKDYAGYNAESGSISAKDFYGEFFDLNKDLPDSAKEIIEDLGGGELIGDDQDVYQNIGESDKDYAIDLVRLRTSQAMVDIVNRMTFYRDDLSEAERAYLTTEYAKCFSLYKTMTKDTPNMDSWTGFNFGVQSLAVGAARQITQAVEGVEHTFSQLIYGAASLGMQVPVAIDGVFSFTSSILGDFFDGGIDKVNENFDKSIGKFEESAEKVYGEGTALDEMKKSIMDLGQAMEDRKDLASQLFDAPLADLANSYATAEIMARVGSIVGYALTQILVTNPIGQAVGDVFAVGLAEGASVAFTGYHYSTLMNMAKTFSAFASTANTASQAITYMNLLGKITAVSRGLGFMANLYTQGVVDTFMENPALTDAILYGESDKTISEFQSAIRMNVVWNALGEFAPGFLKGTGSTAKKGLNKSISWLTENTKAGAIAQGFARKFVNFFTLRGRKVYEGIAEFMTRNSNEFILEEGSDIPFSGKLNPEKRMQDLRKEIIKVQEDIANTKILGGDGSWAENAKQIDELIQRRIDLEEVLGTSKRLAVAQEQTAIIKNAGLQIDEETLNIKTAELTQLAKKMKQTNLPGSFSVETGDYLNDMFNRQLLLNKQAALKEGKALSKVDSEALDFLNSRIAKYEKTLPTEFSEAYKQAAQEYLRADYRFYYKLNSFLASDAGGNLIPKDTLDAWRADPRYGANGEMYIPLYGVSGFKGAEDLEALLRDPSRITQVGKTTAQVETLARKKFSGDVAYLDPNFARAVTLRSWAQVRNAANMSDVVAKAGRATSIPTDSQGNVLKTSNEISAAKKKMYNDLEQKFESAFRENQRRLGQRTIEDTKVKAKDYYGKVKRDNQRIVDKILGLDQSGLKRYASTLNSEEIEQINKVYTLPAYSRRIRTNADLEAMYNSLSPAQKRIVDKSLQGGELSLKNWNTAVVDDNLDVLLSRQYIKDNKAILKSDFYKDIVGNARMADVAADEALALRTAKANVEQAEQGLKTKDLSKTDAAKLNAKKSKDYKAAVRYTITDAVENTAAALESNTYLEQLVKEYEKAGVSSDMAKQYLIYQWLYDNREANGVLQDIAFRYYNAPSRVSEIKISTDAAKNYSKKFQKAADSIIESRLNKIIAKVQEEGTEGLIDLESTAKRVDEYFEDISNLWGNKQLVQAWDRENGRFVYYKVDHSTYNLITNYPTFKKNNLFARTMARINSIARVGQITIRVASLVTQGFKDTFDAVVLGGWDQLMLDNPDAYKKIAEYIGPDVVEAFKKEMTPGAWKDFLATAEWEGLSVEEAIAKSEVNDELLKMKIEGGPGTSTSYYSYRRLYDVADEAALNARADISVASDTWTKDVKAEWNKAYEKAREAWYYAGQRGQKFGDRIKDYANFLHNARETFLRKQVYRQNFMDALSYGKSLSQARNYAQYFMENATTHFARGFAWGDNIIRSIPYFGAMINGASSMIRLLEVDPIGVMTRFVTNLALPTVGLTVMSLEDPVDAEIYRNIPEYEKENNMHWVSNGQVVTIPLPEALAKFILPIRHAVESIADGNKHAWGELLVSDLLNLPIIPIDGVMMLDWNKANGDPTVWDRVSAVGMDLFNTLAPNAARTAYIATTGRDPYTGEDYGRKKLFQDENGEYQYMTESEFGFANDMANVFKSWGWDVSAVWAEAIFSSVFGAGSLDLAEGIRDWVASAQEGEANLAALVSPSLERAGNVLSGTRRTDERQAQIAWYSIVGDLKEKKKELLASDGKLARYAQDIDMAKDQDTLERKTELYNAEVRNWQDQVMEKVKTFNAEYGGYFDRHKFASALSLLTTQLSIDNVRDSEKYYDARALSIETMFDAGFNGPSDASVFGYVYRDTNTGRVAIKYTDPLVISMSQNLFWYQGDDAVQMIKDTIELSGLKDKYNEVIYPTYNQYMKDKAYDKANKLAAEWDVELMKEIAPIISQYTVGELLSKSTAIDLLDNYILVPSTTEAMGRGKYYSSKTGLNKRRGYAQSYIKKIYNALNKEGKK